jgi:hypothetical protein
MAKVTLNGWIVTWADGKDKDEDKDGEGIDL